MTAPALDEELRLELLYGYDGEGARVALVDPARRLISETLTASARRTGRASFAVVAPRTFTFTRLRPGLVVGLGVYVGDWRGILDLDPTPVLPGDTFDLCLPGD